MSRINNGSPPRSFALHHRKINLKTAEHKQKKRLNRELGAAMQGWGGVGGVSVGWGKLGQITCSFSLPNYAFLRLPPCIYEKPE